MCQAKKLKTWVIASQNFIIMHSFSLYYFFDYVTIYLDKRKLVLHVDEKRKIEVVTGNGKDLDISPVYEHLEVEKPKEEKRDNIIIPDEKK